MWALAILYPLLAWAGIRVAVVDFVDGGPEAAGLARGLQEMVATDLSKAPELTLVERARIEAVKGEIELGSSGLADPATAARIGKLLGATHLLTGACTTTGGILRLDARLVEVDRGTVVSATDVSGKVDEFFDLEKDLVKKVISDLHVVLDAKTRALMGRVHTVDLGALTAFSKGLTLADQHKLDEALVRLEEAAKVDEDFVLANTTREAILAMAKAQRERATTIEVSAASLIEAQKDVESQIEAELLEKLAQTARTTKGDTQLAALAALACRQTRCPNENAPRTALRERGDRYALDRSGEIALEAYFKAALARFPEVPLVPHPFPFHLETFEADLAKAVKAPHSYAPKTEGAFLEQLSHTKFLLRRLEYPAADRIKIIENLLERSGKILSADRLTDARVEVAEAYCQIGAVDEGARRIAAIAAKETDPARIRRRAQELETAARLKEALDADPSGRVAEYVRVESEGLASVPSLDPRRNKHLAAGGAEGRHILRYLRAFRIDDQILWNRVPTMLISGFDQVATGPRGEAHGAETVYVESRDADPAMMVVGAVPGTMASLTFRLQPGLPADWWPTYQHPSQNSEEPKVPEGTPAVYALLGVAGVDRALHRTEGDRDLHHLTASGVKIAGDEVQLVTLTDVSTRPRFQKFDIQEVGKVAKLGGEGAITLRARPEGLEVSRGKAKVLLPDYRPAQGFGALLVVGPGATTLDQLAWVPESKL